METEFDDDCQPADWDHFPNVPDNRHNSLTKTRYSQELDDRLQTESCQFRNPLQSASESKVDALAPMKTHFGRNSDDLTCYEELAETSEEPKRSLPSCHSKDHLIDASSGAVNIVGHAVEKSISAAEKYHSDSQNLKTLDERPDTALRLNAIKSPAADFCPKGSVESFTPAITETLNSINKEGSHRSNAGQKSKVSPSNLSTSTSGMESVDSFSSEQMRVLKLLGHKIIRNTNEITPQDAENRVPKYEGMTTNSSCDVDTVLKKRRGKSHTIELLLY